MRLRNDPKAEEKLAEYPTVVVQKPENNKGNWNESFQNNNPIHIEIGTGKGGFITGMAQQNPAINYIGIERFTTIVVKALNNIVEANITNAKLLNVNAANILDFFATGEVDRVYLNFSDPWPKDRHEKRRLTYQAFLKQYEQILKKNGEIHFKTDNRRLFEYSLESFSRYGMIVKNISVDLHNSDMEGNVMTEYEQKFSEQGMRIYRCEAQFK